MPLAAGNMTEQDLPAAATKKYTHDAWNRLTSVSIDAAVRGEYEWIRRPGQSASRLSGQENRRLTRPSARSEGGESAQRPRGSAHQDAPLPTVALSHDETRSARAWVSQVAVRRWTAVSKPPSAVTRRGGLRPESSRSYCTTRAFWSLAQIASPWALCTQWSRHQPR